MERNTSRTLSPGCNSEAAGPSGRIFVMNIPFKKTSGALYADDKKSQRYGWR